MAEPAAEDASASPYWWMLLGSFAFAVMGLTAVEINRHCDWQISACVRSGLVGVFALILALQARAKLVLWKPGFLWVRGLAGSVSMVCTFYAFSRMTAAEVMTLTNTFPIWVALLYWPLYGRRPSGVVWAATLLAVGGVVLIEQPSGDAGASDAVVSCLVAAMATAVAMLGLNQLGHLDARSVVVHFSFVAFGFCLASTFLFPRKHDLIEAVEPWTLLLLLCMAMSATLGQLCLTRAFTTGIPTKVSVVGLTQIVFALLFQVMLGLVPGVWTLVGIVLVVVPSGVLMLYRSA